VRLISTHNGVDNLFNQYIQDAREGRKEYSVHRITLDDALGDGLYKRICYVTGRDWSATAEQEWRDKLYKNSPNKESADEEYGCVPKKSGGNYLTRVLIEAAMVADRSITIYRYEAPDNFESWSEAMREQEMDAWCREHLLPELEKLSVGNRHVFGEDFARKGDLTVFVPLAIQPDLRKAVPFAVELRNLTYKQQEQVMFFILKRLPRFTGSSFDSTGNGGYLAEQAALRYGTTMVDQVSLNQGWYAEWMPKLKAEFESFSLELPRHQTVLDDLLSIKVVSGIPLIDKGRQKDLESQGGKGKRHGDFAVALAMAIRASWMEGGSIEFTPLPGKRESSPDYDDDYHRFERGAW
jgi:phage FluMu gp28-like protein